MKVSIIIPVYNCERYVSACIGSALSQTMEDYEVIVVNDGSTDGTRAEIEKFRKRIVYIEQENRGVSAARNEAILRSGAEYVAFLDADDIYRPDNLEKMSTYLDAHPECGLVHCFFGRIDGEGREMPMKRNRSYSGRVVFRRRLSRVYREQARAYLDQGKVDEAIRKALRVLVLNPLRRDVLGVLVTALGRRPVRPSA